MLRSGGCGGTGRRPSETRRWFVVLVAGVIALLLGSPAATTAFANSTYGYDVPTIVRVGAYTIGAGEAGRAQLGADAYNAQVQKLLDTGDYDGAVQMGIDDAMRINPTYQDWLLRAMDAIPEVEAGP